MKRNEIENQRSEITSLYEQATTYLRQNGATNVAQLHAALVARNPSLTELELTDLVWGLVQEGQADLEDVRPAVQSLREYLRIWERNLWFYASIAISLTTVLVIYVVPVRFPFVAVRWILGSLFVLFIPGYVSVEAIYPDSHTLHGIERLALSVVLSIALVPSVGLLFNYTPLGIRLDPTIISLTVLTVGFAILGLVRQYRFSVE